METHVPRMMFADTAINEALAQLSKVMHISNPFVLHSIIDIIDIDAHNILSLQCLLSSFLLSPPHHSTKYIKDERKNFSRLFAIAQTIAAKFQALE